MRVHVGRQVGVWSDLGALSSLSFLTYQCAPPFLVVPNREVSSIYGLDVLIFLRTLKTQATALFICMVYGLGVLVVVHAGGTGVTEAHPPWGLRYTTANLKSTDSNSVHKLFMWVLRTRMHATGGW